MAWIKASRVNKDGSIVSSSPARSAATTALWEGFQKTIWSQHHEATWFLTEKAQNYSVYSTNDCMSTNIMCAYHVSCHGGLWSCAHIERTTRAKSLSKQKHCFMNIQDCMHRCICGTHSVFIMQIGKTMLDLLFSTFCNPS